MPASNIATNAEVLQTARKESEEDVGGEDIVTAALEEAQEEVLGDYGDPSGRSTFILSNTQLIYEFRVDNTKTYRLDLVIVRDNDNERVIYTEADSGDDPSETDHTYTKDFTKNTITFAQATVNKYDGKRVEVQYVPNFIHVLVRTKAALYLVDSDNINNMEESAPTLGLRLLQRVRRLEESNNPVGAVGSSNERYYDPTYGDLVPQRRFITYN